MFTSSAVPVSTSAARSGSYSSGRGRELGRRHVRDRGSASRSRGGRSCRRARTGSRRRTSSKYGATISASGRPATQAATRDRRGTASPRRRGRCRSRSRRRGGRDGRGSSASWPRSYVISTPNRIVTPCGAQRSAASRTIRSRSSNGDEVVGRRAGLEVDVVGDRDLGDPALDGLRGVDVDRDVAVGREVRVEVGVERQVAGLGRRVARSRPGSRHPAIRPSSRPTGRERLERPVELLVGVGGGHDRPDPGLVDRDGREDDRLGEDALLEEPLAEAAGRVRVAHHHRRDRRLRRAGVEAEPGELGLEPPRVRPEPLDAARARPA